MATNTNRRTWAWAAVIAGTSLVACATPPTAELAKAELAVEKAETGDPASLAPSELHGAREKLDQAQEANQHEEYDQARRLAEEALVDAELAEARAHSDAARADAREVHKSVETLREELDRSRALRSQGGSTL